MTKSSSIFWNRFQLPVCVPERIQISAVFPGNEVLSQFYISAWTIFIWSKHLSVRYLSFYFFQWCQGIKWRKGSLRYFAERNWGKPKNFYEILGDRENLRHDTFIQEPCWNVNCNSNADFKNQDDRLVKVMFFILCWKVVVIVVKGACLSYTQKRSLSSSFCFIRVQAGRYLVVWLQLCILKIYINFENLSLVENKIYCIWRKGKRK